MPQPALQACVWVCGGSILHLHKLFTLLHVFYCYKYMYMENTRVDCSQVHAIVCTDTLV